MCISFLRIHDIGCLALKYRYSLLFSVIEAYSATAMLRSLEINLLPSTFYQKERLLDCINTAIHIDKLNYKFGGMNFRL